MAELPRLDRLKNTHELSVHSVFLAIKLDKNNLKTMVRVLKTLGS